jgi:hypothetical protein
MSSQKNAVQQLTFHCTKLQQGHPIHQLSVWCSSMINTMNQSRKDTSKLCQKVSCDTIRMIVKILVSQVIKI